MILKKIKRSIWITFIGICLLLSGCSMVKEYDSSLISMGTIIQQKIWSSEDITEDVNDVISNIEQTVLSDALSGADIYRINASAGSVEGVEVSEQFYDRLMQIDEVAQKSQGALDISLGNLIQLWDVNDQVMTGQTKIPTEESIQLALENTGYEKIQYEDGRVSLPEGMSLYLGAVGKGIASDEVLKLLQETGTVKGAILSIGGCVVTYGEKLDGSLWSVAIKNPLEEETSSIGTLVLEGEWVVSTSGNYERYFEVDGKRYHHILNPKTGYPVENEVASVTILSKSGLLSDALSTACFVLGEEDGLKLAEEFDVEALFVTKQGEIRMTEGMKGYFRE